MISYDLLSPRVIVVIPRFSEAVKVVLQCVLPYYPNCSVIAVSAEEAESRKYMQVWNSATERTLHILREKEEDQLKQVALMIDVMSEAERSCPLGIILADSPEVSHFEEFKRSKWNLALAETLDAKFSDLQVVEYSDSWKYSPPRIR